MMIDAPILATASLQRIVAKDLDEFKKNLSLIESRLNTSGWEIIKTSLLLHCSITLQTCHPPTFVLINCRPE